MATLRNLQYQNDQRIVDKEGNVVDLGNLDRNFSPMYDTETGEYATNPNLQRFIDNPQLADIEAALAYLKTPPGQETDLSKPPQQYDYGRTGDYESQKITKSETPEYKAYESKEARRKAEQPKVDAASKSLKAFAEGKAAAPYQPFRSAQPEELRFDGTYEDRQRFKKMIIDTKFAGENPFTFDPISKVESMPTKYFQGIYERRFSESTGQMPLWWDLDEGQRQSFIKEQKAIEVKKAQAVQSSMAAQFKDYLGDYEAQAAINEHEAQLKRETEKTARTQYRAATEKRDKQRQDALIKIAELTGKIQEAEAKLPEIKYWPDQEKTLQEQIKAYKAAIKVLSQQVGENRNAPVQVEGAQVPVKRGSRTRGKPDAETMKRYADMAGLTRLINMGISKHDPRFIEAWKNAKQKLEDDGYDTDPLPEGQRPVAQESAGAAVQPKQQPTSELYQ